MIPLWFMPYAIACGNCFIIKPSEKVPMTMSRVFELIDQLDLPPGVLSLVNGAKETVDALLDSRDVRAISFVGSSPVAKYIYSRAAANGKRVQCQGGAKNAVVVLPDADMEMATRIVADSSFGCAGQRCLATSVAITVGEARASFTAQDAERYRNLAQTNAVSRQEAQRSSTLDQEARAAVSSSGAALESARQQLKVLEAQIAAARAAEAQARSDLQTAQLDVGYTEIRSPIDGYVSNRAAQVGAYVKQGAYMVSVIPAAGLWVDANFKEDQLAHMRPGQTASIRADVLPHQLFHGRVLSLAHGTGAVFSVIPPENATGNFTRIVQRVPVRIELDPRDAGVEMLRPGLSVTASVDTGLDPRVR